MKENFLITSKIYQSNKNFFNDPKSSKKSSKTLNVNCSAKSETYFTNSITMSSKPSIENLLSDRNPNDKITVNLNER